MGLRDFIDYVTDSGAWDENRWPSEEEQVGYESQQQKDTDTGSNGRGSP